MKVNLVALLVMGAAILAVYLGVTGRYKQFGAAVRQLPLTPASLTQEAPDPRRKREAGGSDPGTSIQGSTGGGSEPGTSIQGSTGA